MSEGPDSEQAPFAHDGHERHYTIGGSNLHVRFGDITSSKADVVVSSDDYLLSAGGGVSLAISRAGGNAIAVDAMKHQGLSWGDVAVTTAGALPAKYVFHVVTIGPGDESIGHGSETDRQQEMVRQAVRKCIKLARSLHAKSIAFPALGTGVAHLDRTTVAAAMADAVAQELASEEGPLGIEIFLAAKSWQSDKDYIVFFEEFAAQLRTPIAPSSTPPPITSDAPTSHALKMLQDIVREEALPPTEATTIRLTELRQEWEMLKRREQPVQVFISYAREDQAAAEVLGSHLAALRHSRLAVWTDQSIEPGEKWDEKIRDAIETADIGIYLVSNWFLSSDYCIGVEWKRALERQEDGSMKLLPVILNTCHWKALVGDLQVLPSGGEPVSRHADQNEAFYIIVDEVMRLAQAIQASRT